MKWELLLWGALPPCVYTSTLCLPDIITTHDQISQAFPFHMQMLEVETAWELG